jgi:hypothetical protein
MATSLSARPHPVRRPRRTPLRADAPEARELPVGAGAGETSLEPKLLGFGVFLRNALRMLLRAMATVPVLLFGWGCSECRDITATWCEGTRVVTCTRKSSGHIGLDLSATRTELLTDCAASGLACFEDGKTASCAIADQTCDASGSTYCVGDQIHYCNASGHPRVTQQCLAVDPKLGGFCHNMDAGAVCSPSPDTCDRDVAHCFDATLALCTDGVWVAKGACDAKPDGGG